MSPSEPTHPTSSPDPGSSRLRVAPGVNIDESSLEISYVRSSGPGGQNVNKRATKAILRIQLANLPIPAPARTRLRDQQSHLITTDDELIIERDGTRSQRRNHDTCIAALCDMVRRALVQPRRRKPTRPTRGSVERRIKAKKQRGEIKRRRRGDDLGS